MTLLTLLAAAIVFCLFVLLMPITGETQLPMRQRRIFIAVVTIAFIASSLGIYGWIGSPRIIPLLEEREKRVAELSAEIQENLQKVKDNPKDLAAWVILGTNFLETGQLDSAVSAFRKAVLLSGGEPHLILAFAKAQIMQADGKVTDEAKKGLEMVLMMLPDNPDARYFMALRKLQDGNTQEAMQDMKTLYRSLPDDSPVKAMINHQIGRE